jgi:hypothetical protein
MRSTGATGSRGAVPVSHARLASPVCEGEQVDGESGQCVVVYQSAGSSEVICKKDVMSQWRQCSADKAVEDAAHSPPRPVIHHTAMDEGRGAGRAWYYYEEIARPEASSLCSVAQKCDERCVVDTSLAQEAAPRCVSCVQSAHPGLASTLSSHSRSGSMTATKSLGMHGTNVGYQFQR